MTPIDTTSDAVATLTEQSLQALRTLSETKEAVLNAQQALRDAFTHADLGPNGATETDADRLVAYANAETAYGYAKRNALQLGRRLR
jgi:hypothetical protein